MTFAGFGHTCGTLQFKLRQGLEILDEALRIIVEDDARIEQIVRVKNGLELTHGSISLLAPLLLDKRRHIAARAVLSLQRAVILLDHEPGHVAHHRGIALHLAVGAEKLIDDEVVIALEGMAVDACILIAMVGDKALQLDGGLGQILHGKRHVLDKARGTHRP